MKKYLLSFAVLLGMVGYGYSNPTLGVPLDQSGNTLPMSDYGGYAYSTGAFVVQAVTACGVTTEMANSGTRTNPGVLAGVNFSTASAAKILTDKVLFYDATSYVNAIANGPILSVANVIASTSAATATGGFQGPTRPLRFKNGLIWAPIQASLTDGLYNLITVLVNCNNP